MDLYKSLIIAEYLIKEHIVNPLLKRHKKILFGIILFIAFLVAGLIIATTFAPSVKNTGMTNEQSSKGHGLEIRSIIYSVGLDKDRIIDIISILLMLYLIIGVVKGGKLVVSGAIYELVLSQPISIDTYIMGDTFYKIIQGLVFTPLYFTFIPFAMDLNGGDPKALFVPFSLFTVFFLFGELSHKMIIITHRFLVKKHAVGIIRLILSIYTFIVIIHSVILKYPSPLLTMPLRSLSELLIYPFTISKTLDDLTLSILKAYVIILLCFITILPVSKYITPEDIAPLTEIVRRRMRKTIRKTHAVSLKFNTPSVTVRSYILGNSIMRLRHLLNLGILIGMTIILAYIARHVILTIYGSIGAGSTYITSFFIPFLIAIASNTVISAFLVNDVPGYWIYRVYLIRMNSVAYYLLLKYLVYLSEALFLMSIVDTVLSQNYLFLLFPLIVLPLMTITSFLVLAVITYFASKKKIVKYTQTNMTILEETISGVIMLLLVTFIILSKIGYTIILSLNPSQILLLGMIASSIFESAILFIVLPKILGKLMEKYDLVS